MSYCYICKENNNLLTYDCTFLYRKNKHAMMTILTMTPATIDTDITIMIAKDKPETFSSC